MKELMYSKLKNVHVKDAFHNEKVHLDIVITVEQTYHNNEKVRLTYYYAYVASYWFRTKCTTRCYNTALLFGRYFLG